MRGKGKDGSTRKPWVGITPARAGKSTIFTYSAKCPRDHPRACGEKHMFYQLFNLHQGSPPRVRGKVLRTNSASAQSGITPARAGKSIGQCLRYCGQQDHPRACGEKTLTHSPGIVLIGSPPRVRGKAVSSTLTHSPGRITPARAGKSLAFISHHKLSWDHPRACGEKTVVVMLLFILSGSPPRVRGKVRVPLVRLPVVRITPARAGKSITHDPDAVGVGDHPRACGEKTAKYPSMIKVPGSPPRVRGKDVMAVEKTDDMRITPARAGKSCRWIGTAVRTWDHPRACGEKPSQHPPCRRR